MASEKADLKRHNTIKRKWISAAKHLIREFRWRWGGETDWKIAALYVDTHMYALPSKHVHYYIYAIFASLMAYCPSPVGQHERSLARPLANRPAIFPFISLE